MFKKWILSIYVDDGSEEGNVYTEDYASKEEAEKAMQLYENAAEVRDMVLVSI